MKLLIATGNAGKAREMSDLLHDSLFEVITLARFGSLAEPVETGDTFEANALLKADYYHKHTGLLTVADDSGLEVDALNGRPGVYSARYAGPEASDQARNLKLLSELNDVPEERRTARFVCVAALVGDGVRQTFTGTAEGRILTAPRGTGGFGYDPIFFYPPLAKTFAELSQKEKAEVSHRGQALKQLTAWLKQSCR